MLAERENLRSMLWEVEGAGMDKIWLETPRKRSRAFSLSELFVDEIREAAWAAAEKSSATRTASAVSAASTAENASKPASGRSSFELGESAASRFRRRPSFRAESAREIKFELVLNKPFQTLMDVFGRGRQQWLENAVQAELAEILGCDLTSVRILGISPLKARSTSVEATVSSVEGDHCSGGASHLAYAKLLDLLQATQKSQMTSAEKVGCIRSAVSHIHFGDKCNKNRESLFCSPLLLLVALLLFGNVSGFISSTIPMLRRPLLPDASRGATKMVPQLKLKSNEFTSALRLGKQDFSPRPKPCHRKNCDLVMLEPSTFAMLTFATLGRAGGRRHLNNKTAVFGQDGDEEGRENWKDVQSTSRRVPDRSPFRHAQLAARKVPELRTITFIAKQIQKDPLQGSRALLRQSTTTMVRRKAMEDEYPLENALIDDAAEATLKGIDRITNAMQDNALFDAIKHKSSALAHMAELDVNSAAQVLHKLGYDIPGNVLHNLPADLIAEALPCILAPLIYVAIRIISHDANIE